MQLIADLHIHSKYSRATSPNCDLEGFSKWAAIKGINLLGTGDFTHPRWLAELRKKIKPLENEDGIYHFNNLKLVLSSEVSVIFELNGKTKKMHHILLAPSFEIAEQIGDRLKKYGKLTEDGRPTLSLSSAALVEELMQLSTDIVIIPAHCLPPDEIIHTADGIKQIGEIREGDAVLTHKGRYRQVSKIYKRKYKGKIKQIIPYYFKSGIKTTPEHPFYAIKTHKNCNRNKQYKPVWIPAEELESNDILLFPRITIVKDKRWISPSHYVKNDGEGCIENLPARIPINKDFCRLLGYYMAGGYTDNDITVVFYFKNHEKKYLSEVKQAIRHLFGIGQSKERKRGSGAEIIFYSRPLAKFFSNFCYQNSVRGVHSKKMPLWFLFLPLSKQVELLKGWWRGCSGRTCSYTLLNQFKLILLRLGIVPSFSGEKGAYHPTTQHSTKKKNTIHHYCYSFSSLFFFEDRFGLLKEQTFMGFKTKMKQRYGWIDSHYVYLPIKSIKDKQYDGEVLNLEVEEDNSYVSQSASVHNCWTPWFAIFGSHSGVDSVEEAFEDQADNIFALETGLSSDPMMNWMLSRLDRYTLVSNSDSHSPQKIGREANVFELERLSYRSLTNAIKTRKGFLKTYEFFPEEGKYHYDGHRACGVVLSPEEAEKYGNICPVCKRKLTIGVMHRVQSLADRAYGYIPKNAIPFRHIIPLTTLIAKAIERPETSRLVYEEYFKLVNYFGSEFGVYEAKEEQMKLATSPAVAEAITKANTEKIRWVPGHDGVYGELLLSEQKYETLKKRPQKNLFDFL